MARRKVLKGVLDNFLGTYTSRNSRYGSYWLFGCLVGDLEGEFNPLEFDLLIRSSSGGDSPLAESGELAAWEFAEQLVKARLDLAQVREARLRITRLGARDCPWCSNPLSEWYGRPGYDVSFRATAVAANGRVFECEEVVWVAPLGPR